MLESMIVVGLHDYCRGDGLGLSDFLSEGRTPTENFSIGFSFAIAKTDVGVCRFQDLHVALKASMIFARKVIVFLNILHLI